MARRISGRISISMDVKLHYGDKSCTGTVTNLSESGMFINTGETDFAENMKCGVSLTVEDGMLDVPCRIARLVTTNGSDVGMGVVLLDPPRDYLDFVDNLLYVL